ncbi:hypothetical protein BJ138DRAFT_405780 [Hygrophoropsis aurantiaca]|uniref:Uncharacterized protein n=1 Tax=Hygrophoropsis aurantiaca TaxID=72124 RepID=A0ACB8A4D6_9AGAM|nr:hypothetical protein BJ138DRAFT_405780 [Hygrophoropsis aurantiaca]
MKCRQWYFGRIQGPVLALHMNVERQLGKVDIFLNEQISDKYVRDCLSLEFRLCPCQDGFGCIARKNDRRRISGLSEMAMREWYNKPILYCNKRLRTSIGTSGYRIATSQYCLASLEGSARLKSKTRFAAIVELDEVTGVAEAVAKRSGPRYCNLGVGATLGLEAGFVFVLGLGRGWI